MRLNVAQHKAREITKPGTGQLLATQFMGTLIISQLLARVRDIGTLMGNPIVLIQDNTSRLFPPLVYWLLFLFCKPL